MPSTPRHFLLEAFSANERAVFAHSVELARTQGVIAGGPAGHLAVEERGEGRYVYWMRYDDKGRLTKSYCGIEGSPSHLTAEAQLSEQKELAKQAKLLRKLGFAPVEHDAALVLVALHNAGVFRSGGILVGTHAFGALLNQLGYKATPLFRTEDVDLARPRRLALASAKEERDLLALLKTTGLRFVEVPELGKPSHPSASWRVLGRALKVDLLAPAGRAAPAYTSVAVPELHAHATALPFLDYLLADVQMAVAIGKDHLVPIAVPAPARYCLHKLAIADLRSGMDNPKVDKDLTQAAILAVILVADDEEELQQAAAALPRTLKRHAKKQLPKMEALLASRYAVAAQRLVEYLG